jgi:hypothetical protein
MHQRLAEFMRQTEWWELEPHEGIIAGSSPRGGRCLAHPGREYVVFAPGGGTVTLTLPEPVSSVKAVMCDWLQPLTGERLKTTQQLGPRSRLESPWRGGGPFVVRLTTGT